MLTKTISYSVIIQFTLMVLKQYFFHPLNVYQTARIDPKLLYVWSLLNPRQSSTGIYHHLKAMLYLTTCLQLLTTWH